MITKQGSLTERIDELELMITNQSSSATERIEQLEQEL